MKRILTVFLMLLLWTGICSATEDQIDNYRYIISARIIGEQNGEDVIKARVKEVFESDDYYEIYTYRVMRNSKNGQLDTIEKYSKDDKFIEITQIYANVPKESSRYPILIKIVKYVDKEGK
jgi:hypothetical protein